jgi:predicted HD superfamily hydrolase involved in NAD metabolism
MGPMDRQQLIAFLSGHVSKARLEHCLGVERAALELGPKFGVPPELIPPAALLHDLCREYTADSLLQLASKFGIVINDIERSEPILLHGLVGAELARAELGIDHPEILEAISFHITGAAALSALARLVFVADFVEPGRQFINARVLRDQIPFLTSEQILLRVYNYTICYVTQKGYFIHPNSVAGRNELIFKGVQ